MGRFAPRGHAKLNPQHPQAFAICDRCGFLFNHNALVWDTQYHGRQIRRTGFLVCQSCNDIPNPTLRPIVLPPDPVPILNPRAEPEHCHVFKPRADQQRGPLGGYPNGITADTAFRIWPPIDDTRPDPVTVDIGDVCDLKPPLPLERPPGFPFPPLPPIDEEDATVDHEQPTADQGGTTVDASPVMPPVEIETNTADTTLVSADDGLKLVNVFPDYAVAADEAVPTVDHLAPTADKQDAVPVGSFSPTPPPVTIADHTADTINETGDEIKGLVNVFPDYQSGVDESVPTADDINVVVDDQT